MYVLSVLELLKYFKDQSSYPGLYMVVYILSGHFRLRLRVHVKAWKWWFEFHAAADPHYLLWCTCISVPNLHKCIHILIGLSEDHSDAPSLLQSLDPSLERCLLSEAQSRQWSFMYSNWNNKRSWCNSGRNSHSWSWILHQVPLLWILQGN